MPLIEIGRKMPDFTLKDQDGKPFTLSEQQWTVILFFYPEDDSPACTGQACDFRDRRELLAARRVRAVGISPDDGPSHRAFIDKHTLNMTLLVDEPDANGEPRIALKLGAWGEKLNYGRTYRGLIRTTYVVAPGRRVLACYGNIRAKGHAARVIRELDSILPDA